MKRYEPSHPRLAFGVGAVAAAAITLGSLVLLPAQLEAAGPDTTSIVASAEPHVDSGRDAALDARARRHDLIARAIGAVEHAAGLRLAAHQIEETKR